MDKLSTETTLVLERVTGFLPPSDNLRLMRSNQRLFGSQVIWTAMLQNEWDLEIAGQVARALANDGQPLMNLREQLYYFRKILVLQRNEERLAVSDPRVKSVTWLGDDGRLLVGPEKILAGAGRPHMLVTNLTFSPGGIAEPDGPAVYNALLKLINQGKLEVITLFDYTLSLPLDIWNRTCSAIGRCGQLTALTFCETQLDLERAHLLADVFLSLPNLREFTMEDSPIGDNCAVVLLRAFACSCLYPPRLSWDCPPSWLDEANLQGVFQRVTAEIPNTLVEHYHDRLDRLNKPTITMSNCGITDALGPPLAWIAINAAYYFEFEINLTDNPIPYTLGRSIIYHLRYRIILNI